MRFSDKVLFVTGGASGIGRATAARFVAEGGRVAIADINGERAAEVAAELTNAVGFGLDVADEDSVAAAINGTVEAFGRLDCVLAGAGHAEFGPLEEWSAERFNRMLNVHVTGTFLTCKYAKPHLLASGNGSIVTIASVAAVVAQKINVPYGAAKAAIAQLSKQFALEVAPSVRVNCVAPGRVQTGMTEPLMIARAGSVEKGAEMFGAGNLMKRVGSADELAAAILFLLSDDASFITGTTLIVDGGETAV